MRWDSKNFFLAIFFLACLSGVLSLQPEVVGFAPCAAEFSGTNPEEPIWGESSRVVCLKLVRLEALA